MKSALYYIAGLCSIAICTLLPSCGHTQYQVQNGKKSSAFTADSGYVIKKDLHTLLRINPTDTLFKYNDKYKPTDTLGKYYKNAAGNYFACINIIDTRKNQQNVILEALADGTIIKKQAYYSSMYRCCWNNDYDGFQKKGDYFTYLVCGTGSAYCGGDIHVFKELAPQDEKETITKSIWVWAGPDMVDCYIDLTSDMEVRDDVVIMNYSRKLYEAKENEPEKIIKREKFSVAYVQLNGNWAATDSTRIKDFPY